MRVEVPARADPLVGRLHLARRTVLGGGLALTVLGILAPIFPGEAPLVVGVAAGWLLWMAGAVLLGFSFLTAPGWLRGAGVVAALAVTGAGAFLTFNPTAGALAMALFLTAAFVMDGSFQLALALKLRPLMAWRWVLASGFASLMAALLLAAGFPERSPMAIALLLSLALMTTGLALVAIGLSRPSR